MLAVLLFMNPFALAEPVPATDTSADAEPLHYQAVTQLNEEDFLQLKLQGQLVRPAGSLTIARPQPILAPLFQLRRDFDQEIDESTRLVGS